MPTPSDALQAANRLYWDELTGDYQTVNQIRCDLFHLGPLLPSAEALNLLPVELAGKRCLEVGSGAGQNSICLAQRGALCLALDISRQQIEHGRRLAVAHGVEVTFECLAMEALDSLEPESFDFVHSVYALPFTQEPAAVIAAMARRLRPGGTLLLVVGHPVFAGEWLEIDGEGEGLFLPSYFQPPPDVRELSADEEDETIVFSRTWPISQTYRWLQDAGLVVTKLLEPEPLPVPVMSAEEVARQLPYDSELWRELYHQIAQVPVVVIFQAVKG